MSTQTKRAGACPQLDLMGSCAPTTHIVCDAGGDEKVRDQHEGGGRLGGGQFEVLRLHGAAGGCASVVGVQRASRAARARGPCDDAITAWIKSTIAMLEAAVKLLCAGTGAVNARSSSGATAYASKRKIQQRIACSDRGRRAVVVQPRNKCDWCPSTELPRNRTIWCGTGPARFTHTVYDPQTTFLWHASAARPPGRAQAPAHCRRAAPSGLQGHPGPGKV